MRTVPGCRRGYSRAVLRCLRLEEALEVGLRWRGGGAENSRRGRVEPEGDRCPSGIFSTAVFGAAVPHPAAGPRAAGGAP